MDSRLLDYLTIGGDFQDKSLSLEERLQFCIHALNKATMAYCLATWTEERTGKKADSDVLKGEMYLRAGYQAGLLEKIKEEKS